MDQGKLLGLRWLQSWELHTGCTSKFHFVAPDCLLTSFDFWTKPLQEFVVETSLKVSKVRRITRKITHEAAPDLDSHHLIFALCKQETFYSIARPGCKRHQHLENEECKGSTTSWLHLHGFPSPASSLSLWFCDQGNLRLCIWWCLQHVDCSFSCLKTGC